MKLDLESSLGTRLRLQIASVNYHSSRMHIKHAAIRPYVCPSVRLYVSVCRMPLGKQRFISGLAYGLLSSVVFLKRA